MSELGKRWSEAYVKGEKNYSKKFCVYFQITLTSLKQNKTKNPQGFPWSLRTWFCCTGYSKDRPRLSPENLPTERAACYYYPEQGVSSSRILPMGSELQQTRIKALGHAVPTVPPRVLGNGCKPSLSSTFKSSHTCFIPNCLDQTHFLLTYLFWECIIQYFCFGNIIFFHFVALLSHFKHKFTKQTWHLIPGSVQGTTDLQ